MSRYSSDSLSIASRRRGRRLAYWNGGLWAAGNGLASTPLVVYLALELDSPRMGLGIGLILAAPHLVGVLRLAAPALVEWFGGRKWFCQGCFVGSAVLLAVLPVLAAPGVLASAGASLAALVGLWCTYHLLQYFGTVALWSWLADLAPLRVRGRFIGRRELWMLLGQAVGMVAAGLFTWFWHAAHPEMARWIAYAPPVVLGVGFMLAAVAPLAMMPRAGAAELGRRGDMAQSPVSWSWKQFLAPFGDWRFRRLLLFGCWFSLFNGITQSAMNVYAARVLLFSVLVVLALKTFMRVGQVAFSPVAGRLADRVGNRPVLMVSLLLVAQGPLFYLLATPSHRWWIVGAWIVWIAYVGLNVALPNLMLKLSPRESDLPYIATYFSVTGLCYAGSTIAGGMLLDGLRHVTISLPGVGSADGFAVLFFIGWIARMLGAVVLLAVVEPGTATRSTKNE